ncbi:MAG: sensor histidine kinase [Clostridiaceae bacterium]
MHGIMRVFKIKKLRNWIIFSFIALTLTLIGIIASMVYFYSTQMLQGATVTYAMQALAKTMENIDYVFRDADQMTVNILMDREINSLINMNYETGSYKSLEREHIIREKLRNSYKYVYSFNSEIYLLTDTVYVNTYDNLDRNIIEEAAWYKAALDSNRNIVFSKAHTIGYVDSSINNSVSLVRKYKSIKNYNNNIGAIVVDMDLKEISKIIDVSKLDKYSKILILDGSGDAVFEKDKDYTVEKLKGNAFYKKIDGSMEGVLYPSDGTGSDVVLYYTSTYTGWKIINAIPFNNLMNNIASLRNAVLIISVLCIFVVVILSVVISDRITKPLQKLKDAMRRVQDGDMNTYFYSEGFDEVKTLSNGFNSMLDEMNMLIANLLKEEKEKRKALINSLQAQVNPHFIYNTLNTVKCLARKYNADDIRELVTALVNLLQESISNPNEMMALAKELENVKSYLKIQQYRYNDSFRYFISTDEDLPDIKVPKLIIQPIVENAIFHGIEPKGTRGTLSINICKSENNIVIKIIDDGVGFSRKGSSLRKLSGDEMKFKGIGIKNVDERLKLYYGAGYGLTLFSIRGCGTTVELRIPKTISLG